MAPKFVQGQDGWHHAVSQVQATLVLRPSDHVNLTKHDPCQIHTALRTQAALAPADASKFMVRVDKSKNLAFLLCLDSHVTQPLQEITSVDLDDRRCGVTIYPATPSNTCKGVIHNIPAGTSPEYLMRHMSTLCPEFKILAARMMGRTTTAFITFHGTHIPHEICYAGGIFRCRPHRPKAQYCHRCQQIGHRIDVCTYNARCPTCGQLKPDDDSHTCSADPVCLRCGGPHRADDAACKDKQAADAAVRQLAYNKRIAQRKAALKAEGAIQVTQPQSHPVHYPFSPPHQLFSTPDPQLQWAQSCWYPGSQPYRPSDFFSSTIPPDIPTWTQQLTHTLDQRTKILATNEINPHIDTHLAHSWEARASLLKRWKSCKTNRKLRARIDRLNEHIQQYSDQLSSEHWHASCDELQNTLNTAKTWRIMKALINPDSTKTMTTHKINRLTNQHTDPDTLLAAIKELYVAPACQPQYPNYEGSPHTGLDAEFTYAELRAALRQCKGSKATGPDLVTTALLRNLSDADQDHLLHSINLVWTGKLPLCDLWKKGHMIFIPKPGKPVELPSLRPITLTSHVGKVMERMALHRLQQHLEDTQALPHCMIGYRSHLFTQDTLLRIHEEILQSPSTAELRAILAIDLTKAFDYVDHDAMLSELADTQCGSHMYNYVRDFLRSRTLSIQIGEHKLDAVPHPQRGIPQGAVLSPTLFNLAMRRIHRALKPLPDVRCSLYADDVTIWINRGSPGHIQDSLQAALEAVHHAARTIGLACSVEKTSLLLIHSRHWHPPQVTLQHDTHIIRPQKSLKVLGLHIQSDGGGTTAVQNILRQAAPILNMMRRVATRTRGLKEQDLLRLRDALIIFRIQYQAPYVSLTHTSERKLDALIRKATKIALGLPLTTSTARLVQLGVLPTVSDIIDIHRIHQRQRLSLTPTGRLILHELGYTPHPTGPQPTPLDNTILQHITVAPIPRHMDRDRNPTRRLLRAAYYTRKISRDPESHQVFTDAALKDTLGAFAYITSRGTAHSRTQRCTSPVEAELLAIALAAANNSSPGHTTHIYTDSKSACSHLAQGLAFPSALPLLNNPLFLLLPSPPYPTFSPLVVPFLRPTPSSLVVSKHSFDHLLWDCPHNPAQPHTYTREWLALAVSLEQQRELVAHINRALSGCLD
ncbi:hypothetical protein HPB47_016531 [Ixodes persulcatus]|uniref:Uncharacterized protein n=1 Tax=Ixodes persulcatus TaxID=34615 RepID=A0AC60QT41_IXOPE|nr:hypothetical protein HPB47_016531 [Ixodes persulcatus]